MYVTQRHETLFHFVQNTEYMKIQLIHKMFEVKINSAAENINILFGFFAQLYDI